MKILRFILWLIVVVIIVGAILMFVLPTTVHIERTTTVNAPSSVVYKHISQLKNFNDWTVWGKRDSTNQYTYEGADGVVGAVSNWKGDPENSGEGTMRIVELNPNKSAKYHMTFIQPRASEADSYVNLEDSASVTKVTWGFDVSTPRPWNIFNLFYNMDKMLGKDFDEGLANLKEVSEKDAAAAATVEAGMSAKQYDVKEMQFPSTTFATFRQVVKWKDIQPFYGRHIAHIYGEARKSNIKPGIPAGLYYEWDTNNQQADMAAAIPVPSGTRLRDATIKITDVPASKAVFVDYYGAYDKIADAHTSIDKYLGSKNWKQKNPVIEQYVTDPGMEKDTAKWLTKIIYLVEPK